jgi:hypothetical protein
MAKGPDNKTDIVEPICPFYSYKNGHIGIGYISNDIAITDISIFIALKSTFWFYYIGFIAIVFKFKFYILYYTLPNLTTQSGCPNH